ncbi:hypothetical protein GBA52_018741 [Prunus armeniaca]|nr:hypothetical protein GBA52_018741 [Prunus armeniaca]
MAIMFGKFSEDMVVQMMSRLPPKSLMRFRCLNKSWNNLMSSPSLMAKHLSNSKLNASSTACIIFKRLVILEDENNTAFPLPQRNSSLFFPSSIPCSPNPDQPTSNVILLTLLSLILVHAWLWLGYACWVCKIKSVAGVGVVGRGIEGYGWRNERVLLGVVAFP